MHIDGRVGEPPSVRLQQDRADDADKRPMGMRISRLMGLSIYQKMTFRVTVTTSTKAARTSGFSYHHSRSSPWARCGVSE